MMHTDSTDDRSKPVERMSDEELEGRLSAHRYILSHLLAQLATDSEKQKVLFDWLEERASVSDHQEDPGAVIMKGFAEQHARANEFKVISEDVRRRVELDGGRQASEQG